MGSVTKIHASSSKPTSKQERALPKPSSEAPGNLENHVGNSKGGDADCGRNPPPAATVATTGPAPLSLDGSKEDAALAQAEFLTREEVLRRRVRRLSKLKKYYRDGYWRLMEEVRRQYREYYWKYGKSPIVVEDAEGEGLENGGGIIFYSASGEKGTVENGRLGLGFWEGETGGSKRGEVFRCAFTGCKTKAMPLTKYCHAHILSDSKQILYKSCSYVIKSAQTGPVTCGKPVLRAAVSSLCSLHLQKSQKNVSQALKRAGLNSSSSSIHVIVAEYVRLIQAKRREIQRSALEENVNGDGNIK